MGVSIQNCPRCKQRMRWHSSHRSNSLDGAIETNVFQCGQCERYLAQASVATAGIGHDLEEIEPVAA